MTVWLHRILGRLHKWFHASPLHPWLVTIASILVFSIRPYLCLMHSTIGDGGNHLFGSWWCLFFLSLMVGTVGSLVFWLILFAELFVIWKIVKWWSSRWPSAPAEEESGETDGTATLP